jgi:hypothetical protein
MNDNILLQLRKMGFKESKTGSMQFKFQEISFVASIHPVIGLCLVVSYSGKGKRMQFEEYMPIDSTNKDIANRILKVFETILPEDARIQEENFNKMYGNLRP